MFIIFYLSDVLILHHYKMSLFISSDIVLKSILSEISVVTPAFL